MNVILILFFGNKGILELMLKDKVYPFVFGFSLFKTLKFVNSPYYILNLIVYISKQMPC